MNIRDLVGPFLLATGITLALGSFWNWYTAPERVDVGFVAPTSKAEQEPLYLEVDFEDSQKVTSADPVTVTTKYGIFGFSHEGATLTDLKFIRQDVRNVQEFVTIGSNSILEREMRSFLIALDEKTPYYYEFKDKQETDHSVTVSYQVKVDKGLIEKSFIIDKQKPKIDLAITITPHKGETLRPRLLWQSPWLQEIKDEDFVNAISIDKTGQFTKVLRKKLNERQGYFSPEIFGTENKYFVHALVNDPDHFVFRAYYKASSGGLLSILEAKPVTEKTTWTLSFYVGPKEFESMKLVAPRLEKTLDYGFFSPIAKGMLYLLNMVYRYTKNYGVAIVLLTVVLKLLLLPFTLSGEKKMQKMQDYQRKLQYIQQKFKNDPEELARAREELITKHGLPGMGGCLPLLIQMPIFTGLYGALNNSLELYRAPFVPWIHDLSKPDPYYVLPFLIFLGVLFGSVVSQGDKVDFKKVVTGVALALFLGAWTSSLAAGLALFIFMNTFLHFVSIKAQRMFDL